MATKLKTFTIELVRGESKIRWFKLPDKETGEGRQLETGESLVLGVVNGPDDNEYVLEKVITNAQYDSESQCFQIKFDPIDTENLAVKDYSYDIWLVWNGGGEKIPLIAWSKFKVTKNAVSAKRGVS